MEALVVTQPEIFAFVESLAADMSSGSLELPSFPEIVVRIRQALGDENCTTNQLSQLISSEPAIATPQHCVAGRIRLMTSVRP
jgi:HD-like signal output (HDOD) protein